MDCASHARLTIALSAAYEVTAFYFGKKHKYISTQPYSFDAHLNERRREGTNKETNNKMNEHEKDARFNMYTLIAFKNRRILLFGRT